MTPEASPEAASETVMEHLRPAPRDMAALVAIGVAQASTIIGTVLVLRRIVDLLNGGSPPSEILPLTIGFCALGVLLALTRGVEYSVAERIGYRMVAWLRMVLFGHLVEMPVRDVNRSAQGALLLRFTGDLSTYRTWVSRGLSRGIVSAITLAGGLAVIFVIDWVIALAVSTVLFFGAATSALWGYQVRRKTRAVRWRRSLLSSNVAEQIRSLAVVQAFGREAGETKRLGSQNDDLLGSLGRAADARGILRFVSSAAGSLSVGAVLVVGVLELDRQRVTIGGVVAAMTAARFLTGPVRTLGRSHEYWQAAQVSKRKLHDFMVRRRRSGTDDDLAPLRVRRGRIEFCDVTVSGALENVDLAVEPGEVMAILGDNSAGKSTMLSLVGRFADPDSGTVLVDGQDLATCSLRSTVRSIGIVSPDLPLMRGTIRRNLTYRYSKASDEMIQHAVLQCRVDEVMESSGGGLDSWLVEGGLNLSTGHRQRIALARAILGSPRLLLLDEPTTNLDSATKEVFRRVIARYQGTVLLVTHDAAEASLADRVCCVDAGRIVRLVDGDQFRTELSEQRHADAGRVLWS